MDGSHKHNVEQKKPDTQRVHIVDSISIKYQIGQRKSMLPEVRTAVIGGGGIVIGRECEVISVVLVSVLFPDLGTGYMGVFTKPYTYDVCAVQYSYLASIKSKSSSSSSSSSDWE